MATNLALDNILIMKALKLGNHKTKKDAVNAALEEYIRHHEQQKITEAFGKIDIDEKFDYKKQRKRK